jgi:hypothetical protein
MIIEVTSPNIPPIIDMANESVCTRLSKLWEVSSKAKVIWMYGQLGSVMPITSGSCLRSMKDLVYGAKKSVAQES